MTITPPFKLQWRRLVSIQAIYRRHCRAKFKLGFRRVAHGPRDERQTQRGTLAAPRWLDARGCAHVLSVGKGEVDVGPSQDIVVSAFEGRFLVAKESSRRGPDSCQ